MSTDGADVLLVGSVPLETPDAVFQTASETLGAAVHRIPDGEIGRPWLQWLYPALSSVPQFEKVRDPVDQAGLRIMPEKDMYPLRLRDGVVPDDIRITGLRYAEVAIASYQRFAAKKRSGQIAADVRFLVAIPTPMEPVVNFFMVESQAAVEEVYERALHAEIDRILAEIPHDQLSLQWDIAKEVLVLEGAYRAYFGNGVEAVGERLARVGDWIPADVEMGYHLCYGRHGGKHFREPTDLATVVGLSNAVVERIGRAVDFVHMPVPIGRDDDGYFAPLADLVLPEGMRLYLGLIHEQDGRDGAARRIAAARRYVDDFGISTECGLGGRAPAAIPDLLRLHADVVGDMARA